MKRILSRVAIAVGALAASSAAMAGNIDTGDSFYKFYEFMDQNINGALGIGLALTFTLMGGVFGVMRNSPMPALSGVGGAALLHWSPDIIRQIMLSGAIV